MGRPVKAGSVRKRSGDKRNSTAAKKTKSGRLRDGEMGRSVAKTPAQPETRNTKRANTPLIDIPTSRDNLNPELEAYKIRLLELRRQGNRDNVELVVEMGEILMEAKPKAKGSFGAWVEEMGMSRMTANNYIGLAQMAKAYPAIIHRYKELGVGKLYLLLRLPDNQRLSILKKFDAEALFRMTDADYVAEVIAPHALPSTVTVTPAMKAHGFTMKLKAWSKQVEEFRTYLRKHKSAALPEDTRNELLALKSALEELV